MAVDGSAPTIRPATPQDAEAIRAIYAPVVESTLISFEEVPPSAAEMTRRMLLRPRLPWLVAVDGSRVVGYAYAAAHHERSGYRWSADASIFVEPACQGQGVGRALYGRLIATVRDLGYVSLFAGIALPNAASVALHKAMGFRSVGVDRHPGRKLGVWADVGWWQLELVEPSPQPLEPREWSPG
ncbi:MAG: N-acetyltransferase family protein [Candidatus Dormibacteria bacterium]